MIPDGLSTRAGDCLVADKMFVRPRIVGIVNITEDSYSDGGLYFDTEAAIAHARQLFSDGADIIELGPASSHPDARQVTADVECQRLAPVLGRLVAQDIPLAVDSFHPETQRFALGSGATYLNDTDGFPHPELYPELARADCRLIVMHSVVGRGQAVRVQTDPATIWTRIDDFFSARLERLEAAGIGRDRLIIDPGLGFFLGANPGPSLAVLGGIRHLRDRFGLPVLVSPSRKSFLRAITGRSVAETGPATLAAELYAACEGVDYVRTHDVRALHDALTVLDNLERNRARPAS
jgi:dihydropteroate synthase